jgi:precorrin-3B synthase
MKLTMRRGACPSLAAPMASGDGLLVRLVLPEGLSAVQLAGLARAAARFGSGLIEVTSRGSLQIRGLRAETVAGLAEVVERSGIWAPAGPPVQTSPLAGRDPAELADPRPLAAALRGFVGPLPPKVAVVVDGGGRLHLDAVAADVRLRAVSGGWLLSVGGTAAAAQPLGVFDEAGAAAAGLDLLGLLSRRWARARDLDLSDRGGAEPPRPRPPVTPVGRFRLIEGFARGVALPFGQADSRTLAALAATAETAKMIAPVPGRALLVIGLSDEADRRLLAAAGQLGLVTEPDDARLSVVACAGAPACASARLPTRAMAGAVAAARMAPDGVRLHLSGCAKRCAQPHGAAVTLLGGPDGPVVTGEGFAVPESLRGFLLAQAAQAAMGPR